MFPLTWIYMTFKSRTLHIPENGIHALAGIFTNTPPLPTNQYKDMFGFSLKVSESLPTRPSILA